MLPEDENARLQVRTIPAGIPVTVNGEDWPSDAVESVDPGSYTVVFPQTSGDYVLDKVTAIYPVYEEFLETNQYTAHLAAGDIRTVIGYYRSEEEEPDFSIVPGVTSITYETYRVSTWWGISHTWKVWVRPNALKVWAQGNNGANGTLYLSATFDPWDDEYVTYDGLFTDRFVVGSAYRSDMLSFTFDENPISVLDGQVTTSTIGIHYPTGEDDSMPWGVGTITITGVLGTTEKTCTCGVHFTQRGSYYCDPLGS